MSTLANNLVQVFFTLLQTELDCIGTGVRYLMVCSRNYAKKSHRRCGIQAQNLTDANDEGMGRRIEKTMARPAMTLG